MLDLITAAFKAVAAFFGWKQQQTLVQSGVNQQQATDDAATVAVLKREQSVAVAPSDTATSLKDGTF